MTKVMSQKSKDQLAHELGFGEKVEDGDWSDVTTGEVGSMVREAIKRGETAIADEAKANGRVHQNAE
ncbi:MAG: small, acid-soluble spore protein, alpha/beta type [Negativicutes bacterium]|nr:small, acid-soluble spore protein, alpha/beta type [Negativicutes bacterium]